MTSFSESSLAETLGVESQDVLSVFTVYSHSDVAIYQQQHIYGIYPRDVTVLVIPVIFLHTMALWQ